jgi:3',5'-cyclic AMP phosphodiesterase CpdA
MFLLKAGGESGADTLHSPGMPAPVAPLSIARLVLVIAAALWAGSAAAQPPAPGRVAALDRQALVEAIGLRADANVVIAAGDIARCADLEAAAATATLVEAIVEAAGTAIVITAGDHTYPDGTRDEFGRCYTPTWGRFESITYPSPGNHDYRTENGAPFYDYFSIFDRDASARSLGYYSFEFAGWRLVALNSMISMDDDDEQAEWLERVVSTSTSTCLLAYWHHPAFTSGLRRILPWNPGYRTRDAWETLHEHDAEIVVNGHEHFYERFLPMDDAGEAADGGIRQFTTGTGGGELHVRSLAHGNRARHLSVHGVLLLMLSPDGYEYRFVGIDGVVHDASDGPIRC